MFDKGFSTQRLKMTQQLSFQDKVNIGCNDDSYNKIMLIIPKYFGPKIIFST
jgi:hypothetical protein